jgi:hypothetical protein
MSPILIEQVAEAIYRSEGGMTDEDHKEILGEPRRVWAVLAEWERDGYRAQAKAAMDVIDRNLPLFKVDGRGRSRLLDP